MRNYLLNLDLNFINYLITGNKLMMDKIIEFVKTPIKVSYKERKDYNSFDKVVLNPLFLFAIVFFVTFQAFSISGDQEATPSDSALGNAMVYFERGDFDNAILQLEEIVENFPGTSASHQAKFYLGRTAFLNGNNDKAKLYISESVKKLKYAPLKKEAYMMLGKLEKDVNKALKHFDDAFNNALSSSERKLIMITKAEKLIKNNEKERALQVLDEIDKDIAVYNEFFEEIYGYALSLN